MRNTLIEKMEYFANPLTCDECETNECNNTCPVHRYPINLIIAALLELLKAEPKRGRWIIGDNGEWACSECKYEPVVFENTPFCANCGARMRDVKKKEEADT